MHSWNWNDGTEDFVLLFVASFAVVSTGRRIWISGVTRVLTKGQKASPAAPSRFPILMTVLKMRKLIEPLYGDGTDGFEYEIQRVTSLGADEGGVNARGRAEVSLLLLSGEVLRSTGADRE